MLPLSAHFIMFEDKCIWYPDERSNYAFYDECLTKLLLITALLLFGVMSVSINIHRAARINKRRLNSERKHGGIWKRMRTLYVCIFAPLLASLCQHFLILGAVCCTLRICKLKTSSSSSLRTAEREREKKSLPLNCLRWQKWHSGLNIYQLHEINELGEMQKKMTLWLFFKGALAPRRWCFWTARCSNVLRCAASRFDPALIFLPDTDSDTWTLCWHHVCLFRSAVNCREPIKNNKKQNADLTNMWVDRSGLPGLWFSRGNGLHLKCHMLYLIACRLGWLIFHADTVRQATCTHSASKQVNNQQASFSFSSLRGFSFCNLNR